MGRRGLHNEGAEKLRDALAGQGRGRRRDRAPPVHADLRAAHPWLRPRGAARQRPVRLHPQRDPLADGRGGDEYLHGRRVYVDSVGRAAAAELDPFAVAVLDEIGIDMSRHRPRSFDDLEDDYFDLVISLSPEAQHRAVELTRTSPARSSSGTSDPSLVDGSRETRLDAYRALRDLLMRRIRERFPLEGAPEL